MQASDQLSGIVYYTNTLTRVSQWEAPTPSQAVHAVPPKPRGAKDIYCRRSGHPAQAAASWVGLSAAQKAPFLEEAELAARAYAAAVSSAMRCI